MADSCIADGTWTPVGSLQAISDLEIPARAGAAEAGWDSGGDRSSGGGGSGGGDSSSGGDSSGGGGSGGGGGGGDMLLSDYFFVFTTCVSKLFQTKNR